MSCKKLCSSFSTCNCMIEWGIFSDLLFSCSKAQLTFNSPRWAVYYTAVFITQFFLNRPVAYDLSTVPYCELCVWCNSGDCNALVVCSLPHCNIILFRKINEDLSSNVIQSLINRWVDATLQNAGWRDLFYCLSAHVAVYWTCLVIGSALQNSYLISSTTNYMMQGVLAAPSAGFQTVFSVCLTPNNSLFLWKSGTFQRLNGLNEPQCCASGGCLVSVMKLMIMCPAESHCVFPTVMVMGPVFFFQLTKCSCCLFFNLLSIPSSLIWYLYIIICKIHNAV